MVKGRMHGLESGLDLVFGSRCYVNGPSLKKNTPVRRQNVACLTSFALLSEEEIKNQLTRAFEFRSDRIGCPSSSQQPRWNKRVLHFGNPRKSRPTDQR